MIKKSYFERTVTVERTFTFRASPELEQQAPELLAAAQRLVAAIDVQEPFAHLGYLSSRFGDYRLPQFYAVIHDGDALTDLRRAGQRVAAVTGNGGEPQAIVPDPAVRQLLRTASRVVAATKPHGDVPHVLPARDAYRLELATRGGMFGQEVDDTMADEHHVEHGWPTNAPLVEAFLKFGYDDGEGANFTNHVAVAIERRGIACRTDWNGPHNYMIFALETEREFGVWEPVVEFTGGELPPFAELPEEARAALSGLDPEIEQRWTGR